MLYECLKVISTCHTNGMTHGDVKPAVSQAAASKLALQQVMLLLCYRA